MTRPMVEITEEMEAWARRVAASHRKHNNLYPETVAAALAVLAALPQPPRPLAVGDVVDRFQGNVSGEPLDFGEWEVRGFADDAVALVRRPSRSLASQTHPWTYQACVWPLYRVGESEPAPWPWSVES